MIYNSIDKEKVISEIEALEEIKRGHRLSNIDRERLDALYKDLQEWEDSK